MFTTERIPPRPLLGIALALLLPLAGGRPAAASPIDVANVADAAGVTDADNETAGTAGLAAAGESQGSYGYFRVVEGAVTVVEAGSGTRSAAAVNQPVMPGDRVVVAQRGRVEIVLSDRNLLRLDGGSEMVLAELAGTPDTSDRATR